VWRAALGHTLLSPRQVDCRMNDVALWLDSRALRSLHRLHDVSAAEGDITAAL